MRDGNRKNDMKRKEPYDVLFNSTYYSYIIRHIFIQTCVGLAVIQLNYKYSSKYKEIWLEEQVDNEIRLNSNAYSILSRLPRLFWRAAGNIIDPGT